ncbi:MAG TPA: hypothetical protein VM513_35480 [Kofleriaceae bacterium]|jgi:HEPN domain-containing protein|nr:hypothetical protein [Kofleriaceae bacterium]
MSRVRPIRRARPSAGKPPHARESIRDLSHAIRELEVARDEIAYAYATETLRHRIEALLVEPRSRVDLVQRYLREVFDRLDTRAVRKYAERAERATTP